MGEKKWGEKGGKNNSSITRNWTGNLSTGWRKFDKNRKIPKKVTFRLRELVKVCG